MTESGFNKREDGFEKKISIESEQRFKVEARRDKLLAAWVGEKCRMSAGEIAKYAAELVREDIKTPGDLDVLRKVHADLKARGLHVTEAEIRTKMQQCFEVAANELA